MAKLPHGILKSKTRPGCYVGTDGLRTWLIVKSNSSFGNWCATLLTPNGPFEASRHKFAMNLEEMARKLAYA